MPFGNLHWNLLFLIITFKVRYQLDFRAHWWNTVNEYVFFLCLFCEICAVKSGFSALFSWRGLSLGDAPEAPSVGFCWKRNSTFSPSIEYISRKYSYEEFWRVPVILAEASATFRKVSFLFSSFLFVFVILDLRELISVSFSGLAVYARKERKGENIKINWKASNRRTSVRATSAVSTVKQVLQPRFRDCQYAPSPAKFNQEGYLFQITANKYKLLKRF